MQHQWDADTLQAIHNGNLCARLADCSDEDLNPLVEQIVDRLTSYLDVNEDYKKHQPTHNLYTKVIGDDLHRSGGNTQATMFRGGDGRP